MTDVRQAIVHIVRGGGAQSARRICSQWVYLAREGEIKLQRSERYGGVPLSYNQIEMWAESWAFQTGNFLLGQRENEGHQDLTTHIVASFPPGTEEHLAHAAGRDWAWSMFGSGDNGGEFDYVTAFHTDRPHPHLHVVVNRRSLTGEWLAISHRNMHINYDSLRVGLVEAALRHGLLLEATSREERGLEGHGPTTEQFRQSLRDTQRSSNRLAHLTMLEPQGKGRSVELSEWAVVAGGIEPSPTEVRSGAECQCTEPTADGLREGSANLDVADRDREAARGEDDNRGGLRPTKVANMTPVRAAQLPQVKKVEGPVRIAAFEHDLEWQPRLLTRGEYIRQRIRAKHAKD